MRRARACRSPRPRSGCRARRVRSWAPSACSSRCDNLPIYFGCMPVLKGRMGKIKLFPTTEYSSKQPSDPVVPLVPCLPRAIKIGQNRGSDQPNSGAVGPGGEHRAGADVLGRVGQGGAAAHHPAAAQDHGGVQEVGNEETVPGACSHRRLC